MLNREELKEIAKMQGDETYFVSLYLNVSPITNTKGDYIIHFKNMLKNTIEGIDRAVFKKVKDDFEKIDAYVLGNKREFKKGLAILSSSENSFWKEYHFAVPVKNELIVDKTPYTKPLLDILDNYQRYAILLVDKESARIFTIHLGGIVEYGEVHTPDIPGKHKKGGWFALSQNHYERHIGYHVGVHLKDVVKKFEGFLSGEYIGRLLVGGSDEAVSMVKGLLPHTLTDRIIGTFHAEMFLKSDEVLKRAEPILQAYEKKKEDATVEEILARAMKRENAVIGLEDVLNALQEGRVMKLVFIKDFKDSGYACKNCRYLTKQKVSHCPYCGGEMEEVSYLVDLAAQRAVEQGALIEVISDNKKLSDAGSIGAFLRF